MPAAQAFDDLLLADPGRARRSWERLREGIGAHGLLYGGAPIPASPKPHLVSESRHDAWVGLVTRVLDLLEGVAARLLEDRDLYERLRLPAAARPLVELDPGYRRVAVICRPDCVFTGDALRILELNCDSPAMMTFADHLQDLQAELFPLDELARRYRLAAPRRTPALLAALLDCYREQGGRESAPTIAVVDWRDEPTAREHLLCAEEMTRLGCPAFVADPRELSLREGRLEAHGRPIDLVYRRVLFRDFLARPDDLAPLVSAVRGGRVCMVNPLRSILLGTKALLPLLCEPALRGAGGDALDRAFPAALSVDDSARGWLAGRREGWVLKRADGHGGKHVVLGPTVSDSDWEATLARTAREPWIAQVVEPIPTYSVPTPGGDLRAAHLNWNPFFFGGRFGGAIARTSESPLINISLGGALLPSLTAGESHA